MTISGAANFESGDIQFVFTNDDNEIFAPEVGDMFTFLTAGEGIVGFDNNPDLFLFSLDLASTLDFVVNNDGYSLTLEIVSALADIPVAAANDPPIQTAAVSAPGTFALQLVGVSLLLGAMAARRRRSATKGHA